MGRELFGTDGVRGQAGRYPLDDPTLLKIGAAIGQSFGRNGPFILIGRDPRQSSPHISQVVGEGLLSAGVRVKSVGIVPTPGLAYLTLKTKAAAGVVVTASHNQFNDNGIKVFMGDGQKLTDEQETALNQAIDKARPTKVNGQLEPAEELTKDYEDFLVSSADGRKLDGLKLAIDTANGSASGLAKRVFDRLGARVDELFDQPDGRNINDGCGATSPAVLVDFVTKNKLDAGIALDSDADRLVLVDSQGRQLSGDHIIYILAVSGKRRGAVMTIMSNFGLDNALQTRDIKLERTAVGDRYVMAGLQRTGFDLGGEQSGHIILSKLSPTGDGLLAAVQTLIATRKSGKSLADWRDEVKLLPQAMVNIEVKDKSVLNSQPVQDFVKQSSADLAGQGRLLLRASGTEPLLRLMVEGEGTEGLAKSLADQLKQIVESL